MDGPMTTFKPRPSGRRSIAIFGGSFNPPTNDHIRIAAALAEIFDMVLIVPCGSRPDKNVDSVHFEHRRELIKLAFGGIAGAVLDFFDIANPEYTLAYDIQQRYAAEYPDCDLWHVFGTDIIPDIRDTWQKGREVWNELSFVFIPRSGFSYEKMEMPPSYQILDMGHLPLSSTQIREALRNGDSAHHGVAPEVLTYIQEKDLYTK